MLCAGLYERIERVGVTNCYLLIYLLVCNMFTTVVEGCRLVDSEHRTRMRTIECSCMAWWTRADCFPVSCVENSLLILS